MQVVTRTITLEVEQHGPADGPVLLLIMGLAMQLVAWPEHFISALTGAGLRVIRFDNRDCGLSQGFDQLDVPNLPLQMLRYSLGLPVRAPYSLANMAADAAALLEALALPAAHICGVSMGGMIAQLLAAHYPQRAASLTLAMTSSGARSLPRARWSTQAALLRRPRSNSVDDLVQHAAHIFRVIGSPAWPAPRAELEAQLRRGIERSVRQQGALRQLLAIAAAPDRSPLLARLGLPVHIIHGEDDPLVPIAHGRDLARKIPGATAEFVAGMGHDLPRPVCERLARAIVRHVEQERASCVSSRADRGP